MNCHDKTRGWKIPSHPGRENIRRCYLGGKYEKRMRKGENIKEKGCNGTEKENGKKMLKYMKKGTNKGKKAR
jgi:hypothetical protein